MKYIITTFTLILAVLFLLATLIFSFAITNPDNFKEMNPILDLVFRYSCGAAVAIGGCLLVYHVTKIITDK